MNNQDVRFQRDIEQLAADLGLTVVTRNGDERMGQDARNYIVQCQASEEARLHIRTAPNAIGGRAVYTCVHTSDFRWNNGHWAISVPPDDEQAHYSIVNDMRAFLSQAPDALSR